MANRRQEAYRKYCHLPADSSHMTFEAFKVTAGATATAKSLAMQLAEESGQEPIKWLTLVSEVDRGKTHLAIAICRRWLDRGKLSRYGYVPLLLDELRGSLDKEGEGGYRRQFEMLCQVPLLVMDDLGVEKVTEWGLERLNTLVDYRYINGLPLVVTTNRPLDELPIRIASRLQRFVPGKVVVIDAPEYRLVRKTGG
ncbi:MAG: ATP-binding protein [Gammaproteobacteria bacterium]|nr:ATP-binding protein [Gammaproteobacteria bacterium]